MLKQPQLKGKFIKPATFTTRPKRPGEKEGKDYCFVSKQRFQALLKAKKILEHTRYLGYDYGAPRESVEKAIKQGLNVILCLDIKGASFIKRAYPDRAVTIFVKPPSLSVAKQRILARTKTNKPEEVNKRIQVANRELEYINRYDYCLMNDDLEQAIQQAQRIIQWAISQ